MNKEKERENKMKKKQKLEENHGWLLRTFTSVNQL
jgi:hypothetical protein